MFSLNLSAGLCCIIIIFLQKKLPQSSFESLTSSFSFKLLKPGKWWDSPELFKYHFMAKDYASKSHCGTSFLLIN